MDLFNFSKEEKEDNSFYNMRSHQDVYFIDVADKTNNLQFCTYCDCYRGFIFDRCSTCGNN